MSIEACAEFIKREVQGVEVRSFELVDTTGRAQIWVKVIFGR